MIYQDVEKDNDHWKGGSAPIKLYICSTGDPRSLEPSTQEEYHNLALVWSM
jgi:hypothetical protein